jgi:hypothetical protein
MTTVTFSDGRDHPASYLVYFNGIEIPSQQVTVNFDDWQFPTAQIEIAPDPVMQRIGAEDRMQVAVFYLDDTYGTEFEFRLLFEGEITGWSLQNSPLGRGITFPCVSHLRVLNEIYQDFVTDLNSWVSSAMSKDPSQYYVSSLFPFVDLLFYGLDRKSEVKRPFDILRNVLGVCLKKEAQEIYGTVAMKHFFAAFSRRIDFVNRFVPSPLLEIDVEDNACVFTALEAVRDHRVIDTLLRRCAKFGNGASMWSLLRRLFTDTLYGIAALPAPPIAQVRNPSGAIKGPPLWPKATEGHSNRILNFVTKPQWLYGVPPSCNVIFPSMIQRFNYSEDYSAQPTRVNVADKYWTSLHKQRKEMSGLFDIRVAYPDQAQAELDKVKELGDHRCRVETGRNFLVWPEEFFKGPYSEELELPEMFHFLNESAGTQTQGDPEVSRNAHKEVQRVYAEYEYMRRRGLRRNGSVISTFNPYFVFGFPCMVFDPTGYVHAYAMKGSHILSQQQMSTYIEYTYAQTIEELVENVIEARGQGKDIDTAPAYPVEQVRKVIQVQEKAEQYFSELLHQAEEFDTKKTKTAAFNYLKGLSMVFESGEDKLLETALEDPKLLDDSLKLGPSPKFAQIFKSPDLAMEYISRPAVTLEEYTRFHPKGIRKGKIEAFDAVQGKGAVFFEEILDLTQGPGETPKYDTENKAYVFVAKQPDTRVDWSKRLRAYRQRILKSLVGQE